MDDPQEPSTPEEVAGMVLDMVPRGRPFHPTDFMHEHRIGCDLMRDAVEVLRRIGHLAERQVPGWPEGSRVTEMYLMDKRGARRARRGSYPQLYRLFHGSRSEVFEDGMDSDFSLELKRIIREHGDTAVHAARSIMSTKDADAELVAEAMRWLGLMRDSATHQSRRRVLEWALESRHTSVRDGAAIGIEAMDDPESMPRLRLAVRSEQADWLRSYMKDVLKQMKWTAPRRHIPKAGTVEAAARGGA